MKQLLTFFSFLFLSSLVFAQHNKFAGTWEGDLDAGMQKLRLVFTVTQNDAGIVQLTMQSPQQSAMQMPADTAYINGETLGMEMKKFKISFSGKLINDSTIDGEFIQGMPFPLQLKKVEKASVITKPKRPQTPKPPYPYKSVDVHFSNNKKSLHFGGTLTIPDTLAGQKYPAVILISGSGPQDRDETILGHKPFAVMADHLTKKGFAVLRVDDRGVGKTTGNHSKATSADFADDAEAALDFLSGHSWIDAKNIGLIGHSEGGQIAPMLAARRKEVKFIVLLAGPGIPCIKLLAEQNVAILKSNGMAPDAADAYGIIFEKLAKAIVNAKDSASAVAHASQLLLSWNVPDSVKKAFEVEDERKSKIFSRAIVDKMYNPWFQYFINYDPQPALKKLTAAVLAINGSKDLQVLPASNLKGIENALKNGRTKNYEIKELPQLNHLFQTCHTCTLDEYATLEESFSPTALDIISQWLLKQIQ